MQNAGRRQSSHMLPPSPHMSIKKLPISLEKWQRLVQKEIPSLLAPIHCSYTAHNTLCHCMQYHDPAWWVNQDWPPQQRAATSCSMSAFTLRITCEYQVHSQYHPTYITHRSSTLRWASLQVLIAQPLREVACHCYAPSKRLNYRPRMNTPS